MLKMDVIYVQNYQTALLKNLYMLQKDNTLCDVKLVAKSGSIQAHRLVLMAASPFFCKKLSSSLGTDECIVAFEKVPLELLEIVVSFMYSGSLCISYDFMEAFIDFSEEIGLTEAANVCKEYVSAKFAVKRNNNLNEILTQDHNLHKLDVEHVETNFEIPETTTTAKKRKIPRKTNQEDSYIEKETLVISKAKKTRFRPPKNLVALESLSDNIEDSETVIKKDDLKNDEVLLTENDLKKEIDNSENLGDETQEFFLSKYNSASVTATAMVKTCKSKIVKKSKVNRICKQTKRKKYPCPNCARVLSSEKRLVFHDYSKHGTPYDKEKYNLLPCKVEGCDYIAPDRRSMDVHTKSRHGVERPHVCEFCGKAFKLPHVLAAHINIHTKSRLWECEQCGDTFTQQSGYDIHVRRHHMGESSWAQMCHLCSEKFFRKIDLTWHLYKEHDQPPPENFKVFICDICGYKSRKTADHERHTNAHAGIKQFPCMVCKKSCSTKSELKRHLMFHGEKKFKCSYEGCSYACTDSIGLRKHVTLMHTHKDYKPHGCPACPYRTGVKGNVDKHIRTVHNLEVVRKHTLPLRMKYANFSSGDIITKDGRLVATAEERKRLEQCSTFSLNDSEQPSADDKDKSKEDQSESDSASHQSALVEGKQAGQRLIKVFLVKDKPADNMLHQMSSADNEQDYKPHGCPACPYRTRVKGNVNKHIRTVHKLEVVTKPSLPLRMKYANFSSGDIVTKDGRLVATAEDRKHLEKCSSFFLNDFEQPSTEDKDKSKENPSESDSATHQSELVEGEQAEQGLIEVFLVKDEPADTMLHQMSSADNEQVGEENNSLSSVSEAINQEIVPHSDIK